MKPLIAYVIDPSSRTIAIRTIEGGARGLKEVIGNWIECAARFPNGDTLYVDEEGLLRGHEHWFRISARSDYPLAGVGVLTGREDRQDDQVTHPPRTTLAELEAQVSWLTRAAALELHRGQSAGGIWVFDEHGNAESHTSFGTRDKFFRDDVKPRK